MKISLGDLTQVVVAIDPAVTSGEDADDTGIVVVGRGPHQPELCKLTGWCPGHGYVLADETCHLPPAGWASRALQAFDRWHANRIVAEVNNGGDLVGLAIQAFRSAVPYEAVRASRGKLTRAEPASTLYEQGRVHHIGIFPELEEQLTTWAPDSTDSPDRLDALVWGLAALGLTMGVSGPVAYDDEDWKRIKLIQAQTLGDLPKPQKITQGIFAGDTSSGLEHDQSENGKVAVSPFA